MAELADCMPTQPVSESGQWMAHLVPMLRVNPLGKMARMVHEPQTMVEIPTQICMHPG
jgi:hypothetical protein